jgi:hypothetical protein
VTINSIMVILMEDMNVEMMENGQINACLLIVILVMYLIIPQKYVFQ